MLRRAAALAAFAGLATLSACALPVHLDPPVHVDLALATTTYELPNGLVVLEQPDRAASAVAVRVRYHAGAKDDPPGRSGLAHVVQHLMTSPSRRSAPLEYAQHIAQATGGEAFAYVGLDSTDVGESVPPSKLALALWLEADRMAYPFQPADAGQVRRQGHIVRNERRQRFDGEPAQVLREIARQEIFGAGHPYSASTQGDPAQINALGLDDVRGFAKQHYRPDNATLVITGAFDPAIVRPLVAKYFGAIPPGPPHMRQSLPRTALAKSRTIRVKAPTPAPLVVVAWVAPPPGGDGYLELELAARVVNEHAGYSRWTTQRVADELYTGLEGAHFGSLFTVAIKVRSGTSVEEALGALDDAVATAGRLGRLYEWELFGATRINLATNHIIAIEHPRDRSQRLADDLEYRWRSDSLRRDLRDVQALRAADVGTAATQFLCEQPRVVVIAEPDPSAPPLGGAL